MRKWISPQELGEFVFKPGKIIPLDTETASFTLATAKPPSTFTFASPKYKADSISVTQQFLQQLNRLSNCNVVIQQYNTAGVSDHYRLYCTVCKADMKLDYGKFGLPSEEFLLRNEIRAYLLQHAHEIPLIGAVSTPALREPAGRKFKDVK